ncbi:MAG: carboxypeptidase regulatory-like domain-containing protein, partial [Bacteroidetes bacterium]|nr:carboxypeptidase regulatory-like domain-containing protein [Bacteroidota bacterium]
YNKSGNSFNYSGYQNHQTDANGYLRMSNLSMQTVPSQGVVNPYRRIMLVKDGYKMKYGPSDVSNPTQSSDYVQPLKKGQRYDFHEIIMTGKANVYGYVRDEDDNPVTALIQIADGPFYMTEMTSGKTNYGSPLHRSVPEETEGLVSNLPLNSFQVIDALNAAGGNMQQFNPMSFQASNGVGNMQPANMVYESAAIQELFSQVSKFTVNAPSGNNTRVIVIPMSDQYMADTFYVNISQSAEALNIGTFMVFEKAHRIKVKVKSRNPSRNGNDVIANSPNAVVEIGDYAGTTNSNGVATFRFTTPDSYFRVFVKDGNRVPVEEYKFLPISKQYIQLEYITEPGMEVNGTVLEKSTGNPIVGARVFCESGFTLYGPTVTETFTDQNGAYSLKGLPRSTVTVRATKTSSTKTYVGQSYTVTTPTSVINNVRFELDEIADLNISKLLGFQVEITSAEQQPDNKYKISGAFVNIPSNGNFRLYDQGQRVRFMNCLVEASAQNDANGIPQAKPVNNYIATGELAIRLRLHNAFVADMFSSETGFLSTIRVKPLDDVWGGMQGKVVSDLESFRFSFDYTGKFYVGEQAMNSNLFALHSKPGSYPLREYFLMDMGSNHQEKPIEFTVHNFNAKADAQLSRLVKDTVNIVTKLYPELALSDNVVVNAGTIKVTPATIIIGNPGEQIDFKLEQWGVKSLQGWAYSIPHGGIVIPKARINTAMADIPVSNLILRPTELIMPEAGVDLDNLMLGGNVTQLKKYSNVKAILNLDQACSFDLKPHWRFSVYNSQNTDLPACYIQGLPGFFPQDKINIGSFTVFSNNSTLIQPIYQSRRFYDVGDLSVQSIVNLPDGLDIVGGMNLGIPGMTTPTAVFTYTKTGLLVARSTKAFDVGLEAKGKVYFNGATGTENYIFADKYFEAKGDLYFENDDLFDGKRVALKGRLIKNNGAIQIDIPKLQNNNSPQAFQYIPLEGGQGNTKLKVLYGSQHVVGSDWDFMRYTADLIGVEGMDNDRTLDYVVSGAIEVDDSDGNSIAIKNIDTPLGGLTIVFDWEKVAFTGTLEIKVPIQMGTVSLNSGMFEIQFDGSGFYFDMIGVVSLPGLDAIADVNCGALSGYYPVLPASVIKRHKDIMYLLDVPDYLKNDGIAGIYINANLAPNFANWSISIPVPLFSIGMGVQAGADLNFLVNFGSSASVMAIQAAAYARAYAGVQVLVCEMCIGAMARFIANGTLQFAPQASLAMDACASFTMFGDFCGASFDETIGCQISMSTNSGLDLDVQWSPCGGTANKKDTSCDF